MGHPSFRTLWVAQFVSVFGDFLALFGVISLITFRMHGTPADVALATVAYLLPVTAIAPVAGVLVDRWPVKRVMIGSDLLRAAIAASLVLVHDVPQICLVMALLGLVSSFFGPAQSVALRTLVPREDLLAANAMLAQAFYIVRIAAPALAGPLVAWLTEKACFWLDAGSFLFSAAMIGRLAIVQAQAPAREGSLRALGREFAEGNRFIFTHRALSFAFLGSAAAMFMLSSFSPLVSVYVRDMLGAGAILYGAISASVGAGLILGTSLVHRAAKDRPMANLVLAGLLGLGAGAALLGAFRNTATAALATLTIGAAIAVVIVPAQTLSQKETPPAMQGRVSSTFMSLFSLAQVLGMLLSGALATHLGIRQLFLACGAALGVLAAVGWTWLRPRPQAEPAS
jgi:MFS family permease